jgi:terminal uridylyltransferase
LNTFSAPIHFTTENIGTVEQPQQSSSPRLGNASAAQNILGFNPSINGNNNNTQYTSAQQSRMRASTSTLPSNAYATANQAALLQSLPASAHIVAQAATAAAVAANMAASSQYYRSMTSSSASSPSSSTRLPLQHPYLFQHQPYQPIAYEKHTVELTNCVIAFLSPILPTEEEYRIKEATRRQLERLAGRVSPGAKLLAFGSMANGFALRNSGECSIQRVKTMERLG